MAYRREIFGWLLFLALVAPGWAKGVDLPDCGDQTQVVEPAPDKDPPYRGLNSKGCRIPVAQLKPTQSAVGMESVRCKVQKIEAREKHDRLTEYLSEHANWVPVVRGPDRRFYLTDHHHLSVALLNAEVKPKHKVVNAYLIWDGSGSDSKRFWDHMREQHWVWLRDNQGAEIQPEALPASLQELADDPMRTLSAWVRDSCGYAKCGDERCAGVKHVTCGSAYFLEFMWGEYLRGAPSVRSALDGVSACSSQPLDDQCLADQYRRLRKAFPAAMTAAADEAAQRALGEGFGYNPKAPKHVSAPEGCTE